LLPLPLPIAHCPPITEITCLRFMGRTFNASTKAEGKIILKYGGPHRQSDERANGAVQPPE